MRPDEKSWRGSRWKLTEQCQWLNASRSSLTGTRLSAIFVSTAFDLLGCTAAGQPTLTPMRSSIGGSMH